MTMGEKLLPCPFLSDCGIEMAKWKRAIIDSCPNRRAPDPLAERLAETLKEAVECLGNRDEASQNDYEYALADRARAALAAWEGRGK